MNKSYRLWLIVCAACSTLLAACATPAPLDAGTVVVSPQVQLADLPVIVQQTKPKPAGYFLQSFLGYFNDSTEKPTQ